MTSASLSHVLRHLCVLTEGQAVQDLTDGELLERFRVGREETAFALLVQRHGPMVLGVCQRLLANAHIAEDVFQATFLVLVRQAASIRKPDSLASFLHGIARRLAVKARLRSRRIRTLERRSVAMRATEPWDEMTWQELRSVLDEELEQLPGKYRQALVLCGLEGKTHEQAAREIGCPKSSLSSRLTRAREMLRQRLERRGITVSSAALAAVLTEKATASVPALLTLATVRAATLLATAKNAGVSATVAALTKEGVEALGTTRLKSGFALLLATSLAVAGAGVLAQQARPPEAPPDKTPARLEDKSEGKNKEANTDRYGDRLPPDALLRLGTVRMRHEVGTACAVITSDSKTAIVSDMMGGIRFWNVATGKEMRRLPPMPGVIHSLALSADGKFLVSGHWGQLCLWNAATGAPVAQYRVENDAVMQIVLTPNGKTAAVRFQGKFIDLIDTTTGKQQHRLTGHEGNVFCLAMSPDGKTLASGSWQDPQVRLWDTATGREVRRINAHQRDVLGVAFAPDSKTLASSGNLNPIRFWDLATGRKLGEGDREYSPQQLTYFVDGKTVAGLWNMKVAVWDAATGKLLRESDGYRNMGHLAISPDGKTIATSWGGPHTFDLWDAATLKVRHPFQGHRERVTALAFAGNARTLFSAAGITGDSVTEWDLVRGDILRRIGENPNGANDLTLSSDRRFLAAAGYNGNSIRLWDLRTGKEVRRFEGHKQPIVSVRLSADGKTMASGSWYDKTLRIWDVDTGKQRRLIPLEQNWPCAAVLSPDGKTVAAGGFNGGLGGSGGRVFVWDTATGEVRHELTTPYHLVSTVAFSPDGKRLAAAGGGGPVCLIWDAATGKDIQTIGEGKNTTQHISFSPDGRTLAVGSLDGAVSLWEVSTGQKRAEFIGHTGTVHALAFSDDGRRVASGSDDTTILVWNVTGLLRERSSISAMTVRELDDLWTNLTRLDGTRANRAIWLLIAAPRQALQLFKQRIKPVGSPSADVSEKVARLLVEMDSEEFAAREKATTALEKLGKEAEAPLRKALRDNLSAEVRRRVSTELHRREQQEVGEWTACLRALEVLEHLGTAEARNLLETVAGGEPTARLTQEARAVLKRLDQRLGVSR
jgi:RNA polymerase sigma factor (sigma-70 family)